MSKPKAEKPVTQKQIKYLETLMSQHNTSAEAMNKYCKSNFGVDDYKKITGVQASTLIGVFMCLLHIPFKMKRRYFCSQFVMEMLSLTGGISLRKKPCLYLPNHLPEELQRQKCLLQVNYNPI